MEPARGLARRSTPTSSRWRTVLETGSDSESDEDELNEIIAMLRGLKLPVFHPAFSVEMVNQAMYERVKFSQGQKIPLPAAHGAARLYNDVTQEEMDAALALWKEMCA